MIAHPVANEVTRAGTLTTLVDRPQVRLQVVLECLRVLEGEGLGEVLDEEVERVDHLQVGDQPDGDGQFPGRVGEDKPGQKIPERILLPVDEVVGGFDLERVRLDRSAAVRSRSQPDDVGVNLDQPIEDIAGAMLQCHFDAHKPKSHHNLGRRAERADMTLGIRCWRQTARA